MGYYIGTLSRGWLAVDLAVPHRVSPPGLPSLARASVRPRLRRFSWLLQAVSDICRQTRVLEADEPAPRAACLLACVRVSEPCPSQ